MRATKRNAAGACKRLQAGSTIATNLSKIRRVAPRTTPPDPRGYARDDVDASRYEIEMKRAIFETLAGNFRTAAALDRIRRQPS